MLCCVEINSCFSPRPRKGDVCQMGSVDASWIPVLPEITSHDHPTSESCDEPVRCSSGSCDQAEALAQKRGPVLVQLPPSLAFDARVAGRFFAGFRTLYAGPVVCEPRHPTWFSVAANRLLDQHQVARVAADPPPSRRRHPGRLAWPRLLPVARFAPDVPGRATARTLSRRLPARFERRRPRPCGASSSDCGGRRCD